MLVLYPLDPLDRRRPDDVYAAEAAVCDGLGVGWTLIDHDALVQDDVDRAVRRVPVQSRPAVGDLAEVEEEERLVLTDLAAGLRFPRGRPAVRA